MQSTLDRKQALHVAIIMDGNGRWATAQGLSRTEGHRAGVETIRRVCEAAPKLGVTTLTLFAFSADNWRRPQPEVNALMGLLHQYLHSEIKGFVDQSIRLTVIGRRDRLPDSLVSEIAQAEARTAHGRRLHLRIAIDYSSRESIARSASTLLSRRETLVPEQLARAISATTGDVDLLIRTGGEKRLSDFLLWESAYAELHFTSTMWPDFAAADLEAALTDFRSRQRRFGGVPMASVPDTTAQPLGGTQ